MVKVSDRVMVAGDWHGDSDWGIEVISRSKEAGIDTILHLGDFGFWPGDWGAKFVKRINLACDWAGVKMVVTPGNHEDWARLDEKKTKDKGDGWGAVKHMTEHIIVLPRAHRVALEYSGGSRSLVSLGGAPSIDFPNRREHFSWWRSEMITMGDVQRTIDGGHADIMVAHDSPDLPYAAPAVGNIIHSKDSRRFWSEAGLNYAEEGRKLMHMAYEGVRPKMFFHGHFHTYSARIEDEFQVWSLGMQREAGNYVQLDLDTLTVKV